MESHGNGKLDIKGSVITDNIESLKILGKKTVLEEGVLLFHPENISIHNNVYVGHNTILKGYYKNEMIIGEGTWIGPQCFFHSAGGIKIGKNNVDLGINSVIMPGVTIKRGTQVGAGAVVTKDFPEYSVIAGVPAKLIRIRK